MADHVAYQHGQERKNVPHKVIGYLFANNWVLHIQQN